MRRFALHLLIAALSLSCGVGAALLWKAHEERARVRDDASRTTTGGAQRDATVAGVTIRPQSPLSVSSITRGAAGTLGVEVLNVGGEPIVNFSYLFSKTCAGGYGPGGGGGVGFSPRDALRPGGRFVFEVGRDDPAAPQPLKDCAEHAARMELQINHVDFADGAAWDSKQEDDQRRAGSKGAN